MGTVEEEVKPKGCWAKYVMKSWNLAPTAQGSVMLYLITGLLCLVVGIITITMNNGIMSQNLLNYHETCEDLTDGENYCDLTINIESDLEGPVYLLYGLGNFYQNHRRYLKSKSSKQLGGSELDVEGAEDDCAPLIFNKDLEKTVSWGGQELDPDAVANPCGIVAQTIFSDSYQIYKCDSDVDDYTYNNCYSGQQEINEEKIAWSEDIGTKYRWLDGDEDVSKETQWINPQNQHFIVWMRSAGLPNFQKMYGQVDDGLEAGNYVIRIHNVYDVDAFEGTKDFIMTTSSALGGKNNFIPIAYLIGAGMSFGWAMMFFLKQKASPAYGRKRK